MVVVVVGKFCVVVACILVRSYSSVGVLGPILGIAVGGSKVVVQS